jgi:hypothetical protein
MPHTPKVDICFQIVSTRSYDDYAKGLVDTINLAHNQQKYSYKIAICSPKKIKDDNIIWFEDTHQTGAMYAHNYLYNQSKSMCDIGVILSDACRLLPECFDAVEFLLSKKFTNKKYQITSFCDRKNHPLCLHSCSELVHLYNITQDPILVSGGAVVRFPIFTIETIEKHLCQHVVHPQFKHHYADNWMGYFIASQGEPVQEYNETMIWAVPHQSFSCNNQHDLQLLYDLIGSYQHKPHANYTHNNYIIEV